MENPKLSEKELLRYNRQIILPQLGVAGQLKLKQARVLVAGAGGLGAPLLLYLAAAGIGKLGIIDHDVVDESNLQRQVLFTVRDIGNSKAISAKEKLSKLNPYIDIIAYNEALTSANLESLFQNYDVIADGTDNFQTKYLINDACCFFDKINVSASIFRFEGQLSVFNCLNSDGSRSPNYRDLYPEPPSGNSIPDCNEAGVIGVLPGIMGSLQANEIIKVITGIGDPLVGKLCIFDALSGHTRIIKFDHNSENPLSGTNPSIKKFIDYPRYCNEIEKSYKVAVKEKSVEELKNMIDNNVDFQLIDVREKQEYDIVNLQGTLIPLDEIRESVDKIARNKPVIIHCRSGVRSASAIEFLQKEYGFDNLYNLKGGVLAYADEIDQSLPKY